MRAELRRCDRCGHVGPDSPERVEPRRDSGREAYAVGRQDHLG